jgi:hypothetical protein
MIAWMKLAETLEVLGGARPLPAPLSSRPAAAIARAVWWLFLFALALAFAGRTSKFVYVDF